MDKKYSNELKDAREFLKIAEDILGRSLKTSANRLYFALEKGVIACLNYDGIEIPKNHQKLWDSANELPGEKYYTALRELYDLRMQADYGAMSLIVPLNSEIIKKAIERVKDLINSIEFNLKLQNDKKLNGELGDD